MRFLRGTMALLVSYNTSCSRKCDILRVHTRYLADYVFALPTVAFFLSAIGLFIISNLISLGLGYRKFHEPAVWRNLIATFQWLSYRGFYLKSLRWNSAPVGILVLGAAGATFFFGTLPTGYTLSKLYPEWADRFSGVDLIPEPYYWSDEIYGGSPGTQINLQNHVPRTSP